MTILFVLGFLIVVGSTNEMAFGQDGINDGKKALSNKSYPWYNAEKDGVRRVELGDRPQPRSSNRDKIPLKRIPETTSEPVDWNWGNWNWNWGGGLGTIFDGGIGAITWAILITFILVIVFVLFYAASRMSSNPDEDEELDSKRTMEESIKQLPFDLEATTGDFRQLAQAAYSNGDYRKAITYLFSHVLVSLDQKGLIRLRKGKTNRQYLRELKPHRPLANYYQHVMVPFEAAFFGDHELGQAEFESCWKQLDKFQTGVNQSSQVANA